MINIGFFSEMHAFYDNGSIQKHIVASIDYDRERMIQYLSSGKWQVALGTQLTV